MMMMRKPSEISYAGCTALDAWYRDVWCDRFRSYKAAEGEEITCLRKTTKEECTMEMADYDAEQAEINSAYDHYAFYEAAYATCRGAAEGIALGRNWTLSNVLGSADAFYESEAHWSILKSRLYYTVAYGVSGTWKLISVNGYNS